MGDDQKDKRDKADEIHEALRDSTDFSRKHLDRRKAELQRQFRRVLYSGTERDLIEILRALGIGEDTQAGRHFISEFRRIRGLG